MVCSGPPGSKVWAKTTPDDGAITSACTDAKVDMFVTKSHPGWSLEVLTSGATSTSPVVVRPGEPYRNPTGEVRESLSGSGRAPVDSDTREVVERRRNETPQVRKLIYSAITSLDGYVEDASGSIDWAAPDDEVHALVNDLERQIGTYLYGRRMYQAMVYWETVPTIPDQPQAVQDFTQIWQAADKIVYSKTLRAVSSARTRIEEDFDPGAIRYLKTTAATDITIGGAELADRALRAGLVDELRMFLVPVVLGAGKHALPDRIRLDLQLLDERRFKSGVTYLSYSLKSW